PSSRVFLPGAWRQNDRVRSAIPANLVAGALAGSALWFIQESFAPVYHDCGERWIDENTPIRTARFNRTIEDAEAAAERFARSLRISNRKLRQASGWSPRYPSAREGWRAIIEATDRR